MCLSFPPFDYSGHANEARLQTAVAAAARATHTSEVSCDGAITYVAKTTKGTLAVIYSAPISSHEDVQVVVFPVSEYHTNHLFPCGNFACLESELYKITHPSEFVPYIEDLIYDGPIYRSVAEEESPPDIKPLKVMIGRDGDVMAILRIAEFLRDDMTSEDRAKLGVPMLHCIEKGLHDSNIDPKRVFGNEYDPAVPESKFALLSFLFDSVTSGCDIVIGLIPEGKKEGRFTLCYYDKDDLCESIPLLGLTHGDRRVMQSVDESYYVATNDPFLQLRLEKDQARNGEDPRFMGRPVVIKPNTLDDYQKDYFQVVPESESLTPDYTNLHQGARGMHTSGNSLWKQAQKKYQLSLAAGINQAIDQLLSETVDDRLKEKEHSPLRISNLKGARIPRNITTATLIFDWIAYV